MRGAGALRRRFAAIVAGSVLAGAVWAAPAGDVAASEPVKAFAVGVDVQPRSIVYDPLRNVLYVTVGVPDPTYANMLVTVDPSTGDILDARNVGPDPNALALSPDASALYVGLDAIGTVQKLQLPAMTPSWSYQIPPIFPSTEATAREIAVMPGNADTIAILRRHSIGGESAGVVIVDGGVARAENSALFADPTRSIAFESPGVLWGSSSASAGNLLTRYSVDATGIATTEQFGLGGGAITFSEGRLFLGGGNVLDPGTDPPSLLGVLPLGELSVDPDRDLVYSLRNGSIKAFDVATRSPRGSWRLADDATLSSEAVAVAGDGLLAIGGQLAGGGAYKLLLIDLSDSLLPPGDPGSLGEYTPLTPERILDTRRGLGIGGTPRRLGPGETISVQVAGVGGVPASGADSIVMNVTAVDPTAPSFLTVYPTGIARPDTSSLNFGPGNTVANLVTMPIGAGGSVSVYNPLGQVDVLFDVAGFYASAAGPDGTRFHALAPGRLMDTRLGTGVRAGVLAPQETAVLHVAGRHGIPVTGARAVALNVTVTEPTAPSFLAVWPAGVDRPVVSNLNFAAGVTLANQVIVRVPDNGRIAIYNEAGAAHIVVDVVGYYDDVEVGNLGRFISFRPFRAIDTRIDSPFDPPGDLWPGDILFWGQPDEDLSAHVLNVTVTNTRDAGFVSVYPYSVNSPTPPNASTLNYAPGRTVPNHAISATGPYTGFFNAGGYAHLIVDVVGGFI